MMTTALRRAAGIALWFAVWSFLAYTDVVPKISLATPVEALRAIGPLFAEWSLHVHIGATLVRTILAFALSGTIGLVGGLLVGTSRALDQVFAWPIAFFRSIPVTALLPVSLALFGIGNTSKVALATIGCALIVLVNTAYGARQPSQVRIRVARDFGANRLQVFRSVIIPEALPHIAAGLRVALALSLVLVVVTEMFSGTKFGIGRKINDFHLQFRLAEMYASILVLGGIGLLMNSVLLYIERRAFRWMTYRVEGR